MQWEKPSNALFINSGLICKQSADTDINSGEIRCERSYVLYFFVLCTDKN